MTFYKKYSLNQQYLYRKMYDTIAIYQTNLITLKKISI